MKWRNTRIYRVSLPLLKPLPVKGQMLVTREILRVEQETWDGRKLWAECAPLPGLHQETLAECLEAAKDYVSLPALATRELPISLQTALEILEWQLECPEAKPVADHFANAALLGVPDAHDCDAVIESLALAPVCKVKVGARNLSGARRFLQALASAHDSRELRIDCNQALENCGLDEVKALLQGLPIAYIEEPYAAIEKLKGIARILPVALDESLGMDRELDALAKAWVIKPNRLGWHRSLALFADPGPQAKVLSNSFESLATLQLYAWAYRQNVRRPEACGLGTAFYMADAVAPGAWNAKCYRAAWPNSPLAASDHRGELVWES